MVKYKDTQGVFLILFLYLKIVFKKILAWLLYLLQLVHYLKVTSEAEPILDYLMYILEMIRVKTLQVTHVTQSLGYIIYIYPSN